MNTQHRTNELDAQLRREDDERFEDYPTIVTLYRDSFRTVAEYRREYRDCCQHYGFKARVEGGWKFFEFETDYRTWKNQR